MAQSCNIKPTYMGTVAIDSSQVIMATSASVNYNIPMAFYDGIYGLTDDGQKGPGVGLKSQKGLARPSGSIANAQVTFLATDHFLEAAKTGTPIPRVDFGLFCKEGYALAPAFVNTYSFSCAQSGVPEISVDLISFSAKNDGSSLDLDCPSQPIPTWRDVIVTFPGSSNVEACPISISFSIQNSFTPLYTKGSLMQNFSAMTIRPKIQDVTGSVTFANKMPFVGAPGGLTTMSISYPGYSVSMNIVLISSKSETSGSYVSTTFNFQGVDYTFDV